MTKSLGGGLIFCDVFSLSILLPATINLKLLFLVDIDPPTCSSSNDITRIVAQGTDNAAVYWNEPAVTDNCNKTFLVLRSHDPGGVFFLGTTEVSYNFSDESGNTVACLFNVTVFEGNVANHIMVYILN